MGGFNATLLRIELKRMLRNRRTIIFTLVFPAALFFVFGSGGDSQHDRRRRQRVGLRDGLHGHVRRRADRGIQRGPVVAVERALGWSRQLRLTPLHPTAYIVVKAFVALVMGRSPSSPSTWSASVQGKPRCRPRVGRSAGCSPCAAS